MQDPHDTQRLLMGIGLIVATAFLISVQDLVFKLLSTDLTLWQIFSLRGVFTVPVLAVIVVAKARRFEALAQAISFWPMVRGLCLTATFLAFYAAIPFLSLSTVGAANYVAPIFVALLSARLVGQPVSRLGWLGVSLGFAGVLLLLQPGTDAFSPFTLLPIVGAAFYAVGHIVTRTKCHDIPVASLAMSLNLVMLSVGILVSLALGLGLASHEMAASFPYLFGGWSQVETVDWLVIAGLAAFAVVIGMMLAGAYQHAPPATIATFEYSYLVFAALWDILVFGMSLAPTAVLGMLVIAVAGMLATLQHPR